MHIAGKGKNIDSFLKFIRKRDVQEPSGTACCSSARHGEKCHAVNGCNGVSKKKRKTPYNEYNNGGDLQWGDIPQ